MPPLLPNDVGVEFSGTFRRAPTGDPEADLRLYHRLETIFDARRRGVGLYVASLVILGAIIIASMLVGIWLARFLPHPLAIAAAVLFGAFLLLLFSKYSPPHTAVVLRRSTEHEASRRDAKSRWIERIAFIAIGAAATLLVQYIGHLLWH